MVFYDSPRKANKEFQSRVTPQRQCLVSLYFLMFFSLGLVIISCFLYGLGCSSYILNILVKTASCEVDPNMGDLPQTLSVAQNSDTSILETPTEDKPLMDRDFGCFIMISIYIFILLISIDERDFIDYDF